MVGPETRASLILRLGDPSDDLAWNEFVQIYEPMLFRLASRWGLQDADAREVVQETLIAVSKGIPEFHRRGSGAFRGWLAAITRNKLADHLKDRARREQGSGDSDVNHWLDQQACQGSSESLWQWQQKQQLFTWAAKQVRPCVSETTWLAFYRTSVDGESVRDVARELNLREGMVYVARSRVMARLRQVIGDWDKRQEESR